MKELLTFIIQSIVNSPKKVKISQEEADGEIKLTIKAPKEDIGIIIGQQGKTIKAIKSLLGIQAQGKRFSLEVSEA